MVAMVILASAAVGQATVYDAYTQFNSDQNDPGNLWSYYGVTEGTNDTYWVAATKCPFPGGVSPINAWCLGWDAFPAVGIQDGELKVHPAEGTALAIGWKSPATGTVNASFLVHDLNAGADGAGDHATYDGVSYSLFKGGVAAPLASGYVANGGTSGLIDVKGISVGNGDKLYLQIGDAEKNHWYDFTGVSFSVSEVPEPSTVVLLACGLAGLVAYAWRKRK
jgi:hypothetical protein